MYTLDTEKYKSFWRIYMIIAFCGHSNYMDNPEDEKKILEILEARVGDIPSEFFLGEYGNFDSFAYNCAKKFKKNHAYTKLIFITPYISFEHRKHDTAYQKERFDLILYPELEHILPRYAISHRNKWIVEHADIIIAHITHTYGGAYSMYQYAIRKRKEIYNITP